MIQKWLVLQQVEKGAETIEWAVVTLIVAMAGLATLLLVRAEVGKMFDRVLAGFLGLQ